MDQLAVAIAPVEETGYGAPALGLYASAVVNGQELAEVLDIDVFFEALTGNGPLPLFTCICGVFGCGDYYIGVAHGVDARIWRNRYAPNPAHVIEVGELRFAWPEVRTVATDLLAMLHTLQREKPGVRLMAASTYATASTIMRSKYRPFRRLSSECSLNHRDCGRAFPRRTHPVTMSVATAPQTGISYDYGHLDPVTRHTFSDDRRAGAGRHPYLCTGWDVPVRQPGMGTDVGSDPRRDRRL